MATMAVLAALTSRKKKTMPTIQPKSAPNQGATVAVPNCSADEAEHVFAARLP